MNDFLREDPLDFVMVVLDAPNLERGLYLLLETLERYHQVMVVLNKVGAAMSQDIIVYHDRLEAELQVPVTPEKGQGNLDTDELFATVSEVADHVAPCRNSTIRYGEKWSGLRCNARGQLRLAIWGAHAGFY